MLRITGWLSAAAAAWCRSLDRFDKIYPAERIALQRSRHDEPDNDTTAPAR
jgi:hypothetical protein